MTTKPKVRKAAADPAFTMIAEHKARAFALTRAHNAFLAARTKAEKKHGVKHGQVIKDRAQFTARLNAACKDSMPEYDQWNRSDRADRRAALRMAKTGPTTVAGAAAMIAYMRREFEEGDRESVEDWLVTALKTVARALSAISP